MTGYKGNFRDKFVHRTSRDRDANNNFKCYMRHEQCSCPFCIALDFNNCICKDDCGDGWMSLIMH